MALPILRVSYKQIQKDIFHFPQFLTLSNLNILLLMKCHLLFCNHHVFSDICSTLRAELVTGEGSSTVFNLGELNYAIFK